MSLKLKCRNYRNVSSNSSIERVEEFIYLGTTLIDQNSIQEEIKNIYSTQLINLKNTEYDKSQLIY